MNTCDDLLCLPSWHHGKQRNLSWKSYGNFLSEVSFTMTIVAVCVFQCIVADGERHATEDCAAP